MYRRPKGCLVGAKASNAVRFAGGGSACFGVGMMSVVTIVYRGRGTIDWRDPSCSNKLPCVSNFTATVVVIHILRQGFCRLLILFTSRLMVEKLDVDQPRASHLEKLATTLQRISWQTARG